MTLIVNEVKKIILRNVNCCFDDWATLYGTIKVLFGH